MGMKKKLARRLIPWVAAIVSFPLWCPAVQAAGQWVPFVAQRTGSVYKVSGNSKKLISQTSDVWLRNSDGSTYERGTPLFGNTPAIAPDLATLFDARTGTTYRINYKSQTMTRERIGKPVSPPTASTFKMPPSRFIGQKKIAGIVCKGWRMVWSMAAPAVNAGKPAGEAWFAPSLNFTALENVIIDHAAGEETIIQVTSIHPGQLPDQRLFEIPPKGFVLNK